MEQTKEYVKHSEEQVKKISEICANGKKRDKTDRNRDNADIDYARVLYSSSFRRLQGKMQFLVPSNICFYRNRLTHSLEVSQIARSIAKRNGLSDTLTVQTCSLAHDIGNPPFGHAGEEFLNKCDKKFPYEGNAQTFRILTNIEEKFPNRNGLDLTLRTLLGIVKYPNKRGKNNAKFLYDKDYNLVLEWKKKYKLKLQTIDCQIMDLADEIAYAAHDLEDALKMKYFSIDDLLFEFLRSKDFSSSHSNLKRIVTKSRAYASKAKTYGTSEEYSILFHKKLTSAIVNLLVTDIGFCEKTQGLNYIKHKNLAKGLKKLTFAAVKRSPTIIQYEDLGRKVLSGLYEVLTDSKFNKNLILLPAEYRDPKEKKRTILDYIGGMMDSYAIEQYKIYFGKHSLEQLYDKK